MLYIQKLQGTGNNTIMMSIEERHPQVKHNKDAKNPFKMNKS